MKKIGSRYLSEGLVIASMDSRVDFGNSNKDYLIKRLVVFADCIEETKEFELVCSIEVEVVSIDDGGNGHIEPPVPVYRIPFPYETTFRKALLRLFAEHPKFFLG